MQYYTLIDSDKYFSHDIENFTWGKLFQRLKPLVSKFGYSIYSGRYLNVDSYNGLDTWTYINIENVPKPSSGQFIELIPLDYFFSTDDSQ